MDDANKPTIRLEFYDQATGDLINCQPWPNIPLPTINDRVVLTAEPPLVWCIISQLYFFRPDNLIAVEYFVKQLTLAVPGASDTAETRQTPSEQPG